MENLEIKNIFNYFKNKKVLITGHTGFKGTWFSKLLLTIGADVYGISLEAEDLSLCNLLKLDNEVKSYIQDIRDLEKIKAIVKEINRDEEPLHKQAYLSVEDDKIVIE